MAFARGKGKSVVLVVVTKLTGNPLKVQQSAASQYKEQVIGSTREPGFQIKKPLSTKDGAPIYRNANDKNAPAFACLFLLRL